MSRRLPASLTLPSGRRISLRGGEAASPAPRSEDGPLFGDMLSLFDDGTVAIATDGKDVSVRDLSLADFHVLRAVLTKAELLHEETLKISCSNCDAPLDAKPCDKLEIAPWVDGELDDPELDVTLPFGEAHRIGDEGEAVTLLPRTVEEALPLFAAAGRGPVVVDAALVRAMGIAELGSARDPEKIAEWLDAADDETFLAVTDTFLASHYPHRLGAVIFCPACRARNDVDAPYERELPTSAEIVTNDDDGSPASRGSRASQPSHDDFPSFEVFAELARAIAEPLIAELPGEKVVVVIEGDTPAVDDGGEPLLGSYEPPGLVGSPTVRVYYRTFAKAAAEARGFDWEDELYETIEHELEHHVYFLRGDDPMDASEHAEIDDEAVRIVGRREASRRAAASFADSVPDFVRRTWPIWVIAFVALVLTLLSSR